MSTIKSSTEHLTLNADGSGKDILFQANGVEKASISSTGAFTSTSIDATKLSGTVPNFTSTGIDDNATSTKLTVADTGVDVTGSVTCDGFTSTGIDDNATSTAITISSAEEVTMPLQPSFSVTSASGITNAGTGYTTIPFDTEAFDIGGNFDTATYTFTAPVTGKYSLNAYIGFKSIPLDAQWIIAVLSTSNRGYNYSRSTAQWDAATATTFTTSLGVSAIADMDAGDTALVKMYQYTGTTQTDVAGGGSYTTFNGMLVG